MNVFRKEWVPVEFKELEDGDEFMIVDEEGNERVASVIGIPYVDESTGEWVLETEEE